ADNLLLVGGSGRFVARRREARSTSPLRRCSRTCSATGNRRKSSRRGGRSAVHGLRVTRNVYIRSCARRFNSDGNTWRRVGSRRTRPSVTAAITHRLREQVGLTSVAVPVTGAEVHV